MITLQDQNALINYLSNVKKAVNAKIIMSTEHKMNKFDVLSKQIPNPYEGALKVQTLDVTLGADYEEAVNEMRAAEGSTVDFKAKARTWGVKINAFFVEHKGEMYLAFIENQKVGKPHYTHNGADIKFEDLEPFTPVRNTSIIRQGVDTEVKYRCINLKNILGVTIEGVARYVA